MWKTFGRVCSCPAHCIVSISSSRIEHDNSGQNPSWWLEKLVLRESGTGKAYTFLCCDWLTAEDDGMTFRYLYPVGQKVLSASARKSRGSEFTLGLNIAQSLIESSSSLW